MAKELNVNKFLIIFLALFLFLIGSSNAYCIDHTAGVCSTRSGCLNQCGYSWCGQPSTGICWEQAAPGGCTCCADKVCYRYGKGAEEQERMDYLEFIARVTSHIPDKGQVTVRYYGLYANAHRGKVRKREHGHRLPYRLFRGGQNHQPPQPDIRDGEASSTSTRLSRSSDGRRDLGRIFCVIF
jgi:hypothetical protein